MITLRGAAVVAAAIFTFFLARLTQVGWLYMVDAMLWGVILLSFVLPWLAVMSLQSRLRVERCDGTPAFPGPAERDIVQVELRLENLRSWPRYFLSVGYDCPLSSPAERWHGFFVPYLKGAALASLVRAVECHRRGLHSYGPVTVESKAPFGLFRRRRRLPSPLSVLVYPQVHPLNRFPLMEGVQGTAVRPKRTPIGQEVAGSRQYFPGDPLRHVHWKNTARMGRPMVKEFEDTQENTLIISFDTIRDLGQDKETTLEYSIKVSVSVASYVIQHGGSVRLLAGRLASQEAPWPELLKELALLQAGNGPGLAAVVGSLPARTRVLVIVSETDAEAIEALRRRAGQMSGLAIVVLEGFGDVSPSNSGKATEAFEQIGVPVVSCRQGNLLEALRSLEQVEWFDGPQSGISGLERVSTR